MGPKRSNKQKSQAAKAAAAETTVTPSIPLAHADNRQKHQHRQRQQCQQKNFRSTASNTRPLARINQQITIQHPAIVAQPLLFEPDDYIHTCIHCWLFRTDAYHASKSIGCFNDEVQKSILTHFSTPSSILPRVEPPFSPFDENPNYKLKSYVDGLYVQAYKRLLPDKTWEAPPLNRSWWPTHRFIEPIFVTFRKHYEEHRKKMALEAKKEREVGAYESYEAQIKSADMTEDMQQEAIDVATEGMQKHNIEKDIAQYIKKTFDDRKGPTWHCIVGRNFGSFVTHETKHFIYFYLGHCAILLFKTQ